MSHSAFEDIVRSHMSMRGDVPLIPWSQLREAVIYDFDEGQHMSVLGKTGTGKTTLVFDIMNGLNEERDSYCCAIGTKLRDPGLRESGWPIIHQWPPKYEELEPGHKIILWPPYTDADEAPRTTKLILTDALSQMLREGHWRIFVDEMAYLVEQLGMRKILNEYWNGARASKLSLISGTQRPVVLARSSVSQSDWAITFRIDDEDDRKRAAEILGDRKFFTPVIAQLQKARHEFLIVHESAAAISWIDYEIQQGGAK